MRIAPATVPTNARIDISSPRRYSTCSCVEYVEPMARKNEPTFTFPTPPPTEAEVEFSRPAAARNLLGRGVCGADGTKKRADFYVADDRAEGNARKEPLEKRYGEKHPTPEYNGEHADYKSSRRQCEGNRSREKTKRR